MMLEFSVLQKLSFLIGVLGAVWAGMSIMSGAAYSDGAFE
jgi:hypothetical protein